MDIPSIKKAQLITAIVTPRLPDGNPDVESFEKLIELQLAAGVQGLVIGGTTGEGHLLSIEEHILLVNHTANKYKNRLLIIGNCGSYDTGKSEKMAKSLMRAGADCLLTINPYYGKTSKNGLVEHFKATLEYGPNIIYNVPSRTAQDISPEVVQEIAKNKNFVAVKECSGPERIKNYAKIGINCWTGNDTDAYLSYHYSSALGVISVASNVIPSQIKRLIAEKNQQYADSLQKFIDWLFSEPNPIPLNSILADLDLKPAVFKRPFLPLDVKSRQVGLDLYSKITGLSDIKAKEQLAFKVI